MKRSLFGYGKTTQALAKSGGWDIYDDSFTCKETDAYGNALLPPSAFDPLQSALELPSPGFPPTHPLVQKALHVTSEYDYFFPHMPPCVWITGTNGKTTTTQMIGHLLKEKGAVTGGNIGTPLAELSFDAPLWILETSSFTLHYTSKARPNVYVVLPIKPDHLSWHGSMEAYETAKLKPLEMMHEGSVAILPKRYASLTTNAHLIPYENSQDLAAFLGLEAESLSIKEPFLMDALLALVVQRVLFGTITPQAFDTFVLDPHKLQELRDAQGRLWVNDTKGTNLDATIEALKRYQDKPIEIILGGDDKGVDLTHLFETMQSLHVKIYAIGTNTQKLMDLAATFGLVATPCHTLAHAVKAIDKSLSNKGVGLLSPAAASLDQFSSYVERGEMFMDLVRGLK
ncbi:UDP-N-acetylmuramoyl-L-alanine--D-glutamate ligase [Sulfurospirillum sp. T05]|uniref:UDP-N-acetylmuramoylalanine--D-glutamate ligase n=1 Tax=Sulfurospirillum tamanense TaxID=2813362 RepID=A0ABS2WND9_9BACT|nr:UDP-N-acetylmuramoyl-L-alanine--D-glutamate ligase [Sulfurospirillum tamanensis]MBN2963166.1 UDP-N-acetylmuramoyl-L-alanine--D-glutamate ligase [Sulfurospirillum tamanensis]